MNIYAKKTVVSPERSRQEIEQTLQRYGADQFAIAIDGPNHRAAIQFRIKIWFVRFDLPLPEQRKYRSISEYDQAHRQRWRSLCLALKAKLECVASGITTFEEEFLSHLVIPGGQTFGQVALPQIQHARETGKLPTGLLEWDTTQSAS